MLGQRQGRAGQGRAGRGRAVQVRAGQGRAGRANKDVVIGEREKQCRAHCTAGHAEGRAAQPRQGTVRCMALHRIQIQGRAQKNRRGTTQDRLPQQGKQQRCICNSVPATRKVVQLGPNWFQKDEKK